MNKFNIEIIKKTPKDNLHLDYKYSLSFSIDGNDGSYCQSLNRIARELVSNTVKLKNTLQNDYNSLVVTEKSGPNVWDKEYLYPYFKTEEDANNAKEYLISIFMSMQIVGKDVLKQQKLEKAAISKMKRLNKINKDISALVGKSARLTINTAGLGGFELDNEIIKEICSSSDLESYTIKTTHGELGVYSSELKYTKNDLVITNKSGTTYIFYF